MRNEQDDDVDHIQTHTTRCKYKPIKKKIFLEKNLQQKFK